MSELRYTVLQLNRANGTTVYLVADTQKTFSCPCMAAAERDRLNESKERSEKMKKVEPGEKYYIEVEVDIEHDPDSVWVYPPHHPENEYSDICVYKKHLIPKMEIEKENAEHRKEG